MRVIYVRLIRLVDTNTAQCIRPKNPEPNQSIVILDAAKKRPAHIHASELLLSIANENAAILRPAYYGEQNQCFYDFTTTRKCQAGGTITPEMS